MADHAHGGGGHGPRLDVSLVLIIGVILSVAYLVHVIKNDGAEYAGVPTSSPRFIPTAISAPRYERPPQRYERHEYVRSRAPHDAIPGNWDVVNR